MYRIIYGIVIIFATFFGAFAGLGGGVIIKPVLDLIGHDTIDAVNFISACAVFSMSISSTAKHIKEKTEIDFKFIITLSAGAVLGGFTGSFLFDSLLNIVSNSILKSIQGIILCVLLLISVIYINIKNKKSFKIKNHIGIILIGFVLGCTASFLGVGGGPINVAFLVFFFSMTMKEAAVYSVGTIFFSQLSKLISTGINHTVPNIEPITIIVAVICAVLGGILGAEINKKANEKAVKTVFTVIVAGIAIVNLYNAVTGLIA